VSIAAITSHKWARKSKNKKQPNPLWIIEVMAILMKQRKVHENRIRLISIKNKKTVAVKSTIS